MYTLIAIVLLFVSFFVKSEFMMIASGVFAAASSINHLTSRLEKIVEKYIVSRK